MNIPIRSKLAVFCSVWHCKIIVQCIPTQKKALTKNSTSVILLLNIYFFSLFIYLCFKMLQKNMFYNIFLFVPQHIFFYEFWTVK